VETLSRKTICPFFKVGARICSTSAKEVGSIHRAIQHERGRNAIIAQPAYKSRCFPVAVWHLINEPFALRSPAIEAGHLGGGGGLIDEDKLFWVKDFLFFPQRLTGRGDVGPILFGRV
jgi:hypothetical protein